MDFLIIIVFIIIILVSMIMAYITYDLQVLAGKAGFSKFSLRYFILKVQKIPVKYLFEQYEKLDNTNVSIDFDDLKKYWESKPDEIENIIDILIKADKFGINAELNDIESYNLSEKNSERFYTVLNKITERKEDFPKEKIKRLINSDINIDSYFDICEKAKKIGIKINDQDFDNNELQIIQDYTETFLRVIKLGIETDKKFRPKAQRLHV